MFDHGVERGKILKEEFDENVLDGVRWVMRLKVEVGVIG